MVSHRSGCGRKPQHVYVARKGGAIDESVIVGEERGVEVLGEHDVERVGGRHVVPVGPGGVDERRDGGVVESPDA